MNDNEEIIDADFEIIEGEETQAIVLFFGEGNQPKEENIIDFSWQTALINYI